MAGLIYRRRDFPIVIHRDDRGGTRIEVALADYSVKGSLSAAVVRKWLESPGAIPVTQLRKLPLLPSSLLPWLAQSYLVDPPLASQESLVPRVTLEIADRKLAALPWEQALLETQGIGGLPVVRFSPVFPHVEDRALTLPLRFLQIDPQPDFRMVQSVRQLFAGIPAKSVNLAVETAECSLDAVISSRDKWKWPTADILQFDNLRTLQDLGSLLSTASPNIPGTLGWLSRLTDTWQTRLVILRVDGAAHLAPARQLLAALAARGGPAGLLVGENAAGFLPHFYDLVVHDTPLDIACQLVLGPTFPGTRPTLYIGAWRAESLRVSRIASGLQKIGAAFPEEVKGIKKVGGFIEIKAEDDDQGLQSYGQGLKIEFDPETWKEGKGFEFKELNLGTNLKFRELRDFNPELIKSTEVVKSHEQIKNKIIKLKNLSHYVSGLEFSQETKGVVPLAKELHDFRNELHVHPEVTGVRTVTVEVNAPRNVNTSLWKRWGGKVVRLDPKADSLEAGRPYQLGIQIGKKDPQDASIGRAGLFIEQVKWLRGQNGAWIEVGVTGLDFEVLGDPVQELWLPKEEDSDQIHFSIRPRKSGAARLRFCIYNEQNLIQSFRLVVWVEGDPNSPAADEERRQQLAQALGLDLKLVAADTHFATRCEYSLAADVAGIVDRPPRALSIAANEWNEESVITVKGADKFGVATSADLKKYVQRARSALQRASSKKDESSGVVDYAFGLNGDWNAADAEMLRQPLQVLALSGWQLYDKIFPDSVRSGLEDALGKTPDPIIAVANILAEKVIPWSLLYDRKFRTSMNASGGRPVAFDTCLAALPGKDGSLPVRKCGEHPQCLLHRDQIAKRDQEGLPQLLEETVACPLHFWGFRNIIESPAQQTVPGKEDSQRPLVEHIACPGSPKAVAGFNSTLVSHVDHLPAMQKLFEQPTAAGRWSATSDHDKVVEQLTGADLHVVYLFCHAREDDDTNPASLEFDNTGFVTASDLDYSPPWSTHPLVFLNGCQTAAFSPEALSPFVIKFVRDREAAGVIGTEAPVWERLAAEFAEVFFRNFLTGKGAGESLLLARRILLSKLNPLGLSYTLYALAELNLQASSAAKPT